MTYFTPPIYPSPSQPFNPLLLHLFSYLSRRHGASPSVAGISAFNFHRKIRGVVIIVNHHLFLSQRLSCLQLMFFPGVDD